MRIIFLVLTLFFLFFGVNPVFAITITISNPPSTITDQPFTFDASVSGASAGTNYLRVDLYKEGSTSYFGETYNNSNWYNASDGKQYFPITIVSGQTWTGSIQGKVGSPTATEFPANGTYKLKLRRYTSSGNVASSDQQTPTDTTINLSAASPTPTTTPSSTSSTPSPSSTTSSSSIIISNAPPVIDSTEEFKVSVNLSSPSSPNTSFYLKGAFKKQDKTNYFGLTKVGGTWIKNNNKYEDQYKITTDGSGIWSGNLEIQPDILDLGYEGAGEYIFKVGRYTQSGSLTWSNEITIKINAQEVILEEDASDILGIEKTQNEQDIIKRPKPEESYSLEKYQKVTSESAIPFPTAPPKDNSGKGINPFIILGGGLILSGVGYLIYIFYKFRLKS